MNLSKPTMLHDRDATWRSLAEFVTSDEVGTRLALVYGRRRQGKTLLLDLLARATGGFVFTGLPQAGLVGGAGARVWEDHADTVRSKIYGPHFEELARQWCLWHASRDTLGDRPSLVQSATVACRAHRQGHDLDVVVSRRRPGQRDIVLAIGEAKATTSPVGEGELARLTHLRDLVPADRYEAQPRLLLFARTGFTTELRHTAAARPDVRLIDLERLYTGD